MNRLINMIIDCRADKTGKDYKNFPVDKISQFVTSKMIDYISQSIEFYENVNLAHMLSWMSGIEKMHANRC